MTIENLTYIAQMRGVIQQSPADGHIGIPQRTIFSLLLPLLLHGTLISSSDAGSGGGGRRSETLQPPSSCFHLFVAVDGFESLVKHVDVVDVARV